MPLVGLAPLVIGLLAWQLLGSRDSVYFPVPTQWYHGVADLSRSGALLPAVRVTILSFLGTLALSVAIGTILGAALGRSVLMDRLLGPLLEIGRTMPAGALVPVAVLVMGDSVAMKLVVAVFTSMWPVLLNVRAGAARITTERNDVARVFGLSRVARFRRVTLPSLVPSIMLGTQIAAPVALILVLLVELLTQVSGLGRAIALAQNAYQAGQVYGLVAIAGCLGLLVNWLIGWLAPLIERFDEVHA